MATIEYFFPPQSPFTYLGHERLVDIARRHGAQVEVKPIDMPRVFSVSGGLPLAERPPQRQAYRLVELERFARFLNLPINLKPRHFPVSGDHAARLLIAVARERDSASALALQGAIGRACWVEERDIADWATLTQLAEGAGCGELIAAAQEPEVDIKYQALTDEAIARGVFGAPTYLVAGEMFWGQDRLDFVERALAAQA